MENNYFVFTKNTQEITIERFHICTWEFNNNSALIEFGGEIVNPYEIQDKKINLMIYIPWIADNYKIIDLYEKLKESENSRFIFNDSVLGNIFLDEGQKKNGVIQKFANRNPLCISPIITSTNKKNNIVSIEIDLRHLHEKEKVDNTSVYFRFYIEPSINVLSTRKTGISRSTIIYDLKINERRNFPNSLDINLTELSICKINSCFLFNILPNSYDLTFFDSGSLKNIRTLEYNSFKKYLGDNRVKENELVVVFNKKEGCDSYAFFSIFSKERIGAGQFALAVLVNLICGVLLFMPSFRGSLGVDLFSEKLWESLPLEVYISISIGVLIVVYFVWPNIISWLHVVKTTFKSKRKK